MAFSPWQSLPIDRNIAINGMYYLRCEVNLLFSRNGHIFYRIVILLSPDGTGLLTSSFVWPCVSGTCTGTPTAGEILR